MPSRLNTLTYKYFAGDARSIFERASCPYCVLKVRRSRLIADSLREISRNREELRKPLKARERPACRRAPPEQPPSARF